MKKKKNVAIIQARQGSKRFPKKCTKKISKYLLIEWVVKRTKKSKNLDEIVIATSKKNADKVFGKIAKKLKVKIYFGDENNVLARFLEAADKFNADNIIRICADNPFISHKFLDDLINFYKKNKCDLAFNHRPDKKMKYKCIDGLGAEIFSLDVLNSVSKLAKSKDDKEHVTKFLYRNSKKFIIRPVPIDKKFQINKKLDIDRKSDLTNIIKLVKNNKININSSDQKIIN